MLLRYFFATTLTLLAACTYAEECLVTTLPPERLTNLPEAVDSNNYTDTGVLNVSFANGDQILAEYGTCELSLNAHYLIRATTTPDTQLVQRFVTALTPRADVQDESKVNELVKQLKAKQPLVLDEPIELTGTTDTHTLVLKKSSSPLFTFVLHYRWQAPLH